MRQNMLRGIEFVFEAECFELIACFSGERRAGPLSLRFEK